MVIALLILVLITVLGTSLSNTTTTYMQIAGNEKVHKMSFYAAEAGRNYVAASPALYGADNITLGGNLAFPNDANPSEKYSLGPIQAFNGLVEYLGSTTPPRGSGYGASKFRAHRYKIDCTGYAPINTTTRIEAGAYRLGF